jgi:modulator of FtsH protease
MLQIWSMVQAIRAQSVLGRPVSETIVATIIGQLQVLPFIAGGILLGRSDPNGMYWVAGGVIAIFIFSVLNAWVLLVEILR